MQLENPNVIFDTIDNGIIILDEDLNITYWNRWLEQRTNINKNDIVNKNLFSEFKNIKEKTLKRKIKTTLVLNSASYYSVEPHQYLIEIPLHNITSKVYKAMQQSVTIVPYNLDKKQVCLYIYDQTAQSETNYKLNNTLEELEEYKNNLEIKVEEELSKSKEKDILLFEQSKLASMGEMLGAISHQWRQPLNALGGNIQFLDDDFDDNIVNEQYIKQFISKNMTLIHFMSHTIDDFRNFFRVDKIKTIFSIRERIIATINILQISLDKNEINLIINDEDFNIIGLSREFQQVILNLLNNAKDALIDNKRENRQININIQSNGVIYISDNANGIEKNILNRIFEPYFTTKDEGKGTGIGLYMSKIIIEDHMNGNLSVRNSDMGVLFIIDLSLDIK